MSRKNNQNQNGNQRRSLSEEKKAAVLGNDRKKVKFPLWLIGACVLAIVAAVALMALRPSGPPATTASTASAVAQETNDAFTFQASLFEDGKAHHFDFTTPQGINVRYFILKSSDGIIRAAL